MEFFSVLGIKMILMILSLSNSERQWILLALVESVYNVLSLLHNPIRRPFKDCMKVNWSESTTGPFKTLWGQNLGAGWIFCHVWAV